MMFGHPRVTTGANDTLKTLAGADAGCQVAWASCQSHPHISASVAPLMAGLVSSSAHPSPLFVGHCRARGTESLEQPSNEDALGVGISKS